MEVLSQGLRMRLRHRKWNGKESKACCEWETFEEGLLHTAKRISLPESLISWKMAEHFWYRLSMTGFEAAMTLKQRLMKKEARERSKSISRIESAVRKPSASAPNPGTEQVTK